MKIYDDHVKVIPKGWWWKRFFPKYRKIRKVTESMINEKQLTDMIRNVVLDQMISGNHIFLKSTLKETSGFYSIYKKSK